MSEVYIDVELVSEWHGVVHSKGNLWLASHPTLAGFWSRAGDARQEIVLIGMDIDEASLRTRLDSCLLSDEAMAQNPAIWVRGSRVFPECASSP